MDFLADVADAARRVTGCSDVSFLRTSHVAFVIAPQPHHAEVLEHRLHKFANRATPHVVAMKLPGRIEPP